MRAPPPASRPCSTPPQRLEEANAELQERLIAAHASSAEAHAQVASLEAAHRALEAQLSEMRERARAGDPLVDEARRAAEAKAAEAKRAADAAAEAERGKAALEGEVKGLQDAAADLRKELDAGALARLGAGRERRCLAWVAGWRVRAVG